MQSKIDIINLSLANLGNTDFIQTLDEDNPEAILANANWDVALECVLAEHPWDFAARTVPLSVLFDDDAFSPWDWRYVYPADCVKLRRVFAGGRNALPAPFRTGRSNDNRHRVVLTNQPEAVAEYTSRALAVAHMPPHFANALAWRLAAEVALAKRADPGLAQTCMQAYMIHLEQAKFQDAGEAGPHPRKYGHWLEARHA